MQIEVNTNNSPQYSISAQDIFETLKLGIRGRTICKIKKIGKNKNCWKKK